MSMFQSCKAALDIIGDCTMNLTSTNSTTSETERIYLSKPALPTAATKKGFKFYYNS